MQSSPLSANIMSQSLCTGQDECLNGRGSEACDRTESLFSSSPILSNNYCLSDFRAIRMNIRHPARELIFRVIKRKAH